MNAGWRLLEPTLEDNHAHVVPENDVVEHDLSDECICGPTIELCQYADEPEDYWLVTHHSLDGREFRESQEPR